MCSHYSNEYTQYTISQYKKANNPKLSQICKYGICSKGPKNEFETAVVNEPSVFKPLNSTVYDPKYDTVFVCEIRFYRFLVILFFSSMLYYEYLSWVYGVDRKICHEGH